MHVVQEKSVVSRFYFVSTAASDSCRLVSGDVPGVLANLVFAVRCQALAPSTVQIRDNLLNT